MIYLGDFAEDSTVYIPFNTFSSDDPSASVTITNLADADIKVHKDGSTTEIVTDGATVAIDFDSITGNHLITVDTSADAAYSTGSDYLVRVEGTTVDGATVNAWVGCFSIENRFDEVDVTKWLGTAAATPTTAGVPEVDVTYLDGVAGNVDKLVASTDGIILGTCEGTPTTTNIPSDLTEVTVDHYKDRTIVFRDGNAAGEAKLITGYSAAGAITCETLTTAPAATDTFIIV